jgi:hypothetical protein
MVFVTFLEIAACVTARCVPATKGGLLAIRANVWSLMA